MAKPLTSWLVPSFSQHNCSLVVSGRYSHVSVTKYEDKFASLGQVNSPNSWDKFQICCTDMCLIRFLLNFAVFCEFLWISRLCYCSKYQKPCTYELRHLHITNWRLKICIWRLHFSGWSPKGDLKMFLISSPDTPPLLFVLGNFLSILTFTSPPFMCSRADTAEVSVAVYAGTTIQTRATGTFVVV